MKFSIYLICVISLVGCTSIPFAESFEQNIIDTPDFSLMTWTRDTDKNSSFVIYIEGDGNAFNARGRPTNDPTPHNKFVRKMAADDSSPNVAYIARPCQFVQDEKCSQKYWTTARFAPTVIDSVAYAIKQIAGSRDATLVGFSGGAQVAGLVAVLHPEINVTKLVTYAGNLDHDAWTTYHKLPPLSESLNLADYKNQYLKIPAVHYGGEKDKVIPPHLLSDFVGDVIIVPNAKHGW